MFDTKLSGKAALVVAALGGFLLLGSASSLHARDRDRDNRNCEQRIRRAEGKLQYERNHHGEQSGPARKAWRELQRARASCGDRRDHGRDNDRDRDRDHDRDRNHNHDHDNDRH
jgi:transformer-2 protein